IKRYSYVTIPPHVDFSLTRLGRVVAVKLQELVSIIEASQAEILNNSR
ncbi:winged helix-turn-helix transcriptional regulator, partial [Klebsiella pneumoniae]|nr:winged helix-turn-helix transcriptional regulator [Klebsiella pneumoniae]